MYQINIKYRTGDSFKTYEDEQTLNFSWSKLRVAKENLKRIKEHYLWQASYGCFNEPLPTPDFITRNFTKVSRRFAKRNVLEYEPQYFVFLLQDDGSEVKTTCFWVGHFEALLGAEIVTDPEDGWSFEL